MSLVDLIRFELSGPQYSSHKHRVENTMTLFSLDSTSGKLPAGFPGFLKPEEEKTIFSSKKGSEKVSQALLGSGLGACPRILGNKQKSTNVPVPSTF